MSINNLTPAQGSSTMVPTTPPTPAARRQPSILDRIQMLYGTTEVLTPTIQRRITPELPTRVKVTESPNPEEQQKTDLSSINDFAGSLLGSPSSSQNDNILTPASSQPVVINTSDDEDSVHGLGFEDLPVVAEPSRAEEPSRAASSTRRSPRVKRAARPSNARALLRHDTLDLLGEDLTTPVRIPKGFNKDRKLKRAADKVREQVIASFYTSAEKPERVAARLKRAQEFFIGNEMPEGVKLTEFLLQNAPQVRAPGLAYKDLPAFRGDNLDPSELLELEGRFERILENQTDALEGNESAIARFSQNHENLFAINALIELENTHLNTLRREINPVLPNRKTLFKELENQNLLTHRQRKALEGRLDDMIKTSEKLVEGFQSAISAENTNLTGAYVRFFTNHNPRAIYEECRSIRRWVAKAPILETALAKFNRTNSDAVVRSSPLKLNRVLHQKNEILAQVRAGLMKLDDQNLVNAMNRRMNCYTDMIRWHEVTECAAKIKIM